LDRFSVYSFLSFFRRTIDETYLQKINVYLPRLGFLLGSTNSIDTLEEAEQQGGLKM